MHNLPTLTLFYVLKNAYLLQLLRAHETTINVNEPRKMTPGGLLVCAFSDCSVVVVSLCVGIILRFMPGVEVGMSITQSKRIHAVNVSLPWYF